MNKRQRKKRLKHSSLKPSIKDLCKMLVRSFEVIELKRLREQSNIWDSISKRNVSFVYSNGAIPASHARIKRSSTFVPNP